MLAEEASTTHFGDGGGKNDDLIQLPDPFHKLVDARSFDDVNVVVLALDFNRYGEVCPFENLKLPFSILTGLGTRGKKVP